ncbi:MAG: hypothetical protein J0M08_05285 [Bacteroidetes bacterium]|nr:hypothetical protein [Bacteroidota bacterium]
MQENSSIPILKSFTKERIILFNRFVLATEDNNSFIRFTKHIIGTYPNFDEKKIEKHILFKQLFPQKPYRDIVIRQLFSKLNKAIYHYLSYCELAENTNLFNHTLLRSLAKNNYNWHTEHFLKLQLKNEKIVDSTEIDTFLFEYLNQDLYKSYLYKQSNRSKEPNLQVISDSLDLHYIINKLKIYCEAISYQTISKTEYQIRFIDEILPYLTNSGIAKNILVQFYVSILQLLNSTSEDYSLFASYKKLLFKNYKKLDSEEFFAIYNLSKNYCIKQANLGHSNYVRELFDLYKLELELFRKHKENSFSPSSYKNIASAGLRLKEYDWTRSFIDEFEPFLPNDSKKNTYNFSLASYYFATVEYKKCIKCLANIDHTDLFVSLSARALQARAYFELKEIMPLESLLQSFKMFIGTKKKLGYHRTNYLNFIKFVTRLNRFRYKDFEPKHIQKLKLEIENEKNILEKKWLLEKVSEFN